ncbi:MAG: SH3 domain-containing protein [Rhodoferax sp.]|nr:SH3 domain-containing protein [Rhodoferax sp.]
MRTLPALTMAALLLLASTCSLAQEAMLTKRATTLRDAPATTAATVVNLPAQSALTRLPARQGPWVQVRTAAGLTGWVHLFDVASTAEQGAVAGATTGALRGLTNFFNRGNTAAPTSPTATVGIRGLSAEDLSSAQPNMAALAQAEAQRQDANQARKFAADATLMVQNVAPLPTPAPPPQAQPAQEFKP